MRTNKRGEMRIIPRRACDIDETDFYLKAKVGTAADEAAVRFA
jgi:hypothetical protein